MKIILEENDSCIQSDGKAKMVIVAVTKDDGKIVRCPYAADKSISDLISDVTTKLGSVPVSEARPVETVPVSSTPIPPSQALSSLVGEVGKIKKEDLVKCVKLLPRDKMAPIDMVIFNGDPAKGGIYRVLELPTDKRAYYEVIDDTDYHKAEIPRRVQAYPEEIEFFQKRKPPIPKVVGKFEEIFNCPNCQKRIVCTREDDNKYHGKCEDCDLSFSSDTVREPAVAA